MTPRFAVCSARSPTSSETCEYTLASISFVTYVVRPKRRHSKYVFMHWILFNDLMCAQLGVEPCGFCGAEGCTIRLDQTRNNHINIVSDCQYAFTSFNYEQAKISTKTSPCTNIPIPCPFRLSLGRDQFIWKYNAVVHMATQHSDEKIPVDLLSKMHISLKETDFMKADLEGMKYYRETHDMMNSDDLVEVAVGDKRARASSASSVGGARKNSRYQ